MNALVTADCVGGVWTYALELARGLAARRVSVTLAIMGGRLSVAQRRELAGIPARVFVEEFALEWMSDPWRDVDAAGRWLQEVAAAVEPDVVHLNQFAFGALEWDVPCVVVAHSDVVSWFDAVRGAAAPPEWRAYADVVRRGLAGADVLVAPTRAGLRQLVRLYGHDGETAVIPNGRAVARHAMRKEPVVLTAGRLWDEGKNAQALWRVAGSLPWIVAFAGDGLEVSTPEQPPNVRMLGRLTRAQLDRWLGRASIYASPALYEPFGLGALEAALSGCALVLGDIATQREIWRDAALFVDPRDDAALEDALQRLTSDRALRAEYARRSSARASMFAADRMALAYSELYQRLLAPAAGRRELVG